MLGRSWADLWPGQVVCQLFFQLPGSSPVRFSARCWANLASASQVVCQLFFQLPARSPVRFKPDVKPALLVQARLPASFDLLTAFKFKTRSRPREARPETDRLLPNSLSDDLPEFLSAFCQIGHQISCKVFCQMLGKPC